MTRLSCVHDLAGGAGEVKGASCLRFQPAGAASRRIHDQQDRPVQNVQSRKRSKPYCRGVLRVSSRPQASAVDDGSELACNVSP